MLFAFLPLTLHLTSRPTMTVHRVEKLVKFGLGASLLCSAIFAVPSSAADAVKVKLDWTPWGVHAPFHLAKQKKWFDEAGLDVSLEDGNGSVATVQLVGSNDQFDVGHAALASMMIARDKGLPVKALAVYARRSDVGMLVPSDSGIKGPAQLKGKRVAYTAGSLEAPFIDAFLAAGGVQRKDVELVNVDAASKATTYAVGRTDAAFSTIPFFLPAVSAKRPSIGIPFADYGLHMPSFGLFASESKLKQRPEVLARFAAVVTRAWKYIYDGHQDEAVQAILAERRQARLDASVLRGQIDALESFLAISPATPVGSLIPADWDNAVKTLSSVGLIGSTNPGSSFYVQFPAR